MKYYRRVSPERLPAPDPQGDGVADARITEAMLAVERRLAEPLDIGALAARAGLSRWRFMHLFRQRTGESVAAWVARLRLDHAAKRLRWSDETVGAVAIACGYGSQAAFTRAFAARFGMSPARFRVEDPTGDRDGPGPEGVVEVRERPPMRCLAALFRGAYFDAPARWAQFFERLPEELRPAAGRDLFYAALNHDDPAILPDESLRHTLCVVLPDGRDMRADALRRQGLAEMTIAGGLYAGIAHRGPFRDMFGAYSLLYTTWFRRQTRYRHVEAPPVEVWRRTPLAFDDADVECELRAPVERLAGAARRRPGAA